MSSGLLRRSSRVKRPLIFQRDSSYPDAPPSTQVEKWTAMLDQESFPAVNFARMDDLLTFALFATKRIPGKYRALIPTRAFYEDSLPTSWDAAIEICKIYEPEARTSFDSWQVASTATNRIKERFPEYFEHKIDQKIMRQ
jgi:hypothetical protein